MIVTVLNILKLRFFLSDCRFASLVFLPMIVFQPLTDVRMLGWELMVRGLKSNSLSYVLYTGILCFGDRDFTALIDIYCTCGC